MISICVCVFIQGYIHLYIHVIYIITEQGESSFLLPNSSMHTYMHTYIHTYIHTSAETEWQGEEFIYTYIHTYIHIYIYICICNPSICCRHACLFCVMISICVIIFMQGYKNTYNICMCVCMFICRHAKFLNLFVQGTL